MTVSKAVSIFAKTFSIRRKPQPKVRSRPEPPLFRLPAEVLTIIVNYLPLSNKAAFSITCRRVFTEAATGPLVDRGATQEFLKLIEKDLPDKWLCLHCNKLHNIYSDGSCKLVDNERKCNSAVYSSFKFFPYTRLRFLDVHLAMKRHYLGAPHGIPLEEMMPPRPETSRTGGKAWYSYQVKRQPRIVGDELLFASTYRLYHEERDRKMFELALSTTMQEICPHITIDDHIEHRAKLRLPEIQTYPFGNMAAGDVIGRLGHCEFCYTDYQVSIFNHNLQGCEVMVQVWQNFGAGRHPDDPKWKACSDITWICSSPAWRQSLSHHPGSVRAAFEGAAAAEPGMTSSYSNAQVQENAGLPNKTSWQQDNAWPTDLMLYAREQLWHKPLRRFMSNY